MRTLIALSMSLILLPAAATALVPGDHRLAWYNGDLDSAVDAPTFGSGYGLPAATIGNIDADADQELIINGHAFGGARFVKNQVPSASAVATRTLVPAIAQLEFDLESAPGERCSVYHDLRVILLGTFDPLPALDTLYDLSPVAPLDYFNDEVLVFSAQFTGQMLQEGRVVLDPMQAKLIGGGFPGLSHPFNSFTATEKQVFLSQHYYAVWVAFAAAYVDGQTNNSTRCAFDNFAYIL